MSPLKKRLGHDNIFIFHSDGDMHTNQSSHVCGICSSNKHLIIINIPSLEIINTRWYSWNCQRELES